MLIVSQNKKFQIIIGAGNSINYYENRLNKILHHIYIGNYNMATYKSKDKCLKILRSISDAYANDEKVFFMPDDDTMK